ncbi:MAG: sugar transferase [Cytophagaceae bacterium]|nr:sugar transferase [Cytophagaceae bacterium]MDW8455640.1 sugar transferase [Cytophagaceae bacterium]
MKRRLHLYQIIILDFISAYLAWMAFYFLRKKILGEVFDGYPWYVYINAFLISVFWVIWYWFFGFYVEVYRKSRIKEIFLLLTTTFLGSVILFFILMLDDQVQSDYKNYYKLFALYYLLQYGLTVVIKIFLISHIRRLVKRKKIFFNTLIIGSGSRALNLYREIENSFDILGFKFLAYLHAGDTASEALSQHVRCLGGLENLEKVVRRLRIEQLVIALEENELHLIPDVLNRMEKYRATRISIIPDIHKYLIGSIRVNHNFDLPLMDIDQELMPVWQSHLKRLSDIIVSLIVLTTMFPFFIIIAIIIKLTSKGPILFKQERIGKDGKPFKIIKFRSMYVDAEANGPTLSKEGDKRITKFGRFMRKTRIDEFPQFYNVLVGEMSLVGPRPERQYYIDQIVKIAPHYKHLHKVRPGITSLGQVKFGYAQNVEEMVERLKYDILYIENMSFAMDLRIILYTIITMIQGRGK